MNMNICIFVGARPNFIKIAPIVRAVVKAKAEGKSVSHSLVYAGRSSTTFRLVALTYA